MKKFKFVFIITFMLLTFNVVKAENYYYRFNSEDGGSCNIQDNCIPSGSFLMGSHLYVPSTAGTDAVVNDGDVVAATTTVADSNYLDLYYKAEHNGWVGSYGTGINGFDYLNTPLATGVDSVCVTHINEQLIAADAECPTSGGGGSGPTNTATAFFHSEGTLYQVYFEPGTAVSEAMPKEKTGYEFRCWVDFEGEGAPENRNCIDFDAPGYVTPDGFHFESSYTHIEYTIHYDKNGGSGTAPSDTTCNYDFMNMSQGLENNPCEFASGASLSRSEYYFVGWSLNKDFDPDSEQYFQAGQELAPVLGNNTEITLYAVWQPKTFILEVNKNNGEENLRIPYVYNPSGAKITIIPPTKDYYNFKDWSLPSGVTANATNDEITITVTGPKTITANYVEKEVKFYRGSVSNANLLKTCKMYTDRNGCDLGSVNNVPTHRRFDGWKIKDTSVILPTVIKPQVFDEGNIIVDAAISDIEYKASYVLPDGAVGGNYVEKYTLYDVANLDLGLATKPVKTGYHWTKWTAQDANGSDTYTVTNDNKITVTRTMTDITVTAVMDANKIYIKYNDGSSYIGTTQECTYDQTCKVENRTPEADPNKTFVGWEYNGVVYQTDDDIKNIIAEGTVTLVAKYNFEHDVYYDIVYDMGTAGTAGTLSGNAVSQIFSQSPDSVKLPKADARGYKFNGWEYKLANGNYADITADNNGDYYVSTANAITVENTKKIFVRAKWLNASYDITLKDGDSIVDTVTCEYGSDDRCSIGSHSNLTNDDYRLVGWALSSDGEVVYGDNADITDIYDKDNLSITLYAVKEAKEYKVFYYANGGTLVGQSPQVHSVLTNSNTFDLLSATKPLSNFNGWTTVDGSPVTKASVLALREDVVLIADFDTEYDVVLKVDGTTVNTIHCTYGVACPIEYDTPTKSGYKFIGFFNGEEELGNTITNNDLEVGEIVYNAVFHKRYAVDYYIDDLHSSDITCYVDEPCDLSTIPTAPQKEGYVFTGWSSSVPGITFANPLTVTVNLNKVSFTAEFAKNTYDVKFYAEDEETVIDTKNCTYGVACNISGVTAPAKTHYEFAGWIAKTQGVPYANSITVQRESGIDPVEFVAAYNRVEYDVVFYEEDGTTEIDTLTCRYGVNCNLSSVSAPDKTDWEFDHWETNIGYIPYANPLMVQNDQVEQVKFTAVYKKPYTVRFLEDFQTPYETITCYVGTSCDITVDDPVITGRTFIEWFALSDYEYTESGLLVEDYDTYNVVFQAHLDDQYAVKVLDNYENITTYDESYLMLCDYGVSCPVLIMGVPESDEFTRFKGYFDSNNDPVTGAVTITDTTVTEYELYVEWTNSYKVTLNYWGGGGNTLRRTDTYDCKHGIDCQIQQTLPTGWNNSNLNYASNPAGFTFSNPMNVKGYDLSVDELVFDVTH